ncbi:MAG: NADH-quinone oxidoreductase subunit L [Myxococcota bacterium]
MTSSSLVVLVAFLPLAGAIMNGLFGGRLPGRLVAANALAAVAVPFGLSLALAAQLPGQSIGIRAPVCTWFASGTLDIEFALSVDPLSAVMILLITGVGSLIHLYAIGSMRHSRGRHRYLAGLNMMCSAMLVLVLGDSLPVLFLGWVGVSACAYLIIGFSAPDRGRASAATKLFLTHSFGDVGVLVAMMVLYRYAGTLSLSGIRDAVNSGQVAEGTAAVAALLLFFGVTAKSAQLPLLVWLPDVARGPTAASALIQSGTVLVAGVYLVARLSVLYATAPIVMSIVAWTGVCTALFAAMIGAAQTDIRKILAYSTACHLGFIFVAAGVGAFDVAVFHAVIHAITKACLLLGCGSIVAGVGDESDVRALGGLRRIMPWTHATFLVATVSLAILLLSGAFVSANSVLTRVSGATTLDSGLRGLFAVSGLWIWLLATVAAGLASFAMWRCYFLTFWSGKLRAEARGSQLGAEPAGLGRVALVVFGLGAMLGGGLAFSGVGQNWFVDPWLAPVVPTPVPSPNADNYLEWGLCGITSVAAVVGFSIAWVLYARRIHPLTRHSATERPWNWVYARLVASGHLDELYDTVIVSPLLWASRFVVFRVVERVVIDGIVNGAGRFVAGIGFAPQLLHSGNIQRYLAIFVISIAVLLVGWFAPFATFGDHDSAMNRQAPTQESEH